VPKPLIVARYFVTEQKAIAKLEGNLETVAEQMAEMEEEHGGEDGAFFEWDKVNKVSVTARLKEIKGDPDAKEEAEVLNAWLRLSIRETELKTALRDTEADLDSKVYAKYPTLTEAEVQALVVDDKWLIAGAPDLLHRHRLQLIDGCNDRRGVDQHRRGPRTFNQRIARDETDGGKFDLPGSVRHQQQAAADHVAQRSIGLLPLPCFTHSCRQLSSAQAGVFGNELAQKGDVFRCNDSATILPLDRHMR
jgi:hypothetical protein